MSWLHPGDKKKTWPNITKDARNENKKNCCTAFKIIYKKVQNYKKYQKNALSLSHQALSKRGSLCSKLIVQKYKLHFLNA